MPVRPRHKRSARASSSHCSCRWRLAWRTWRVSASSTAISARLCRVVVKYAWFLRSDRIDPFIIDRREQTQRACGQHEGARCQSVRFRQHRARDRRRCVSFLETCLSRAIYWHCALHDTRLNLCCLADFDLAKDVDWRCAAVEFLSDKTPSIKADVWSFGMTSWEIYSFGATPFELIGLLWHACGSCMLLVLKHWFWSVIFLSQPHRMRWTTN